MGQTIEINRTSVIGDVLIIDGDRTLAGQDGEGFDGPEEARRVVESARRAAAFPARLALRLFETVPGLDHVHVMSNVVTLRRSDGWNDGLVAEAAGVVSDFFRFYR